MLMASLRDHGASRSDRERHESAGSFLLADYPRLGFNFRMTDIQGALGCAQMDRAEWVLRERTRVADAYTERLADVEWLATPIVPPDYVHGWQSYVCLFRPAQPTLEHAAALFARRNGLMARLENRGIATRQGTHAPVLQQFYRDKYLFTAEQFPNAAVAEQISLSLPLFPQLTHDDVDIIVRELIDAFDA
jgi:dTDP-4-amino-4,6-dideoxygalactose transaminase